MEKNAHIYSLTQRNYKDTPRPAPHHTHTHQGFTWDHPETLARGFPTWGWAIM